MAKIRLSKYKYSAYVFMDSKWKFLFDCSTEHMAKTYLRWQFGKDYLEHPEAYKVEKELRSKR